MTFGIRAVRFPDAFPQHTNPKKKKRERGKLQIGGDFERFELVSRGRKLHLGGVGGGRRLEYRSVTGFGWLQISCGW